MPDRSGYRGLLLANWDFPRDSHGLRRLSGPPKDIEVLERALTREGTGRFTSANLQARTNLGRLDMGEVIEEFLGSATRDETLLLYYSGHGCHDLENRLYLCASDSKSDKLVSSAFSASDLKRLITDSAAASVILILDCCYSGLYRGSTTPAMPGRGRFVITSARATQLALDETGPGQPSPFTAAVARVLEATGPDESLTVHQLYQRVCDLVRTERSQVPQLHYRGEGDVYIAGEPKFASESATDRPLAPMPERPTAPPRVVMRPRLSPLPPRRPAAPIVARLLSAAAKYANVHDLRQASRTVRIDPDLALQIAVTHQMRERDERNIVVDRTVSALIGYDLDRAERLAYALVDNQREFYALLRVVEALAAVDLSRAETLARSIHDDFHFAKALAAVARTAGRTSPERIDPLVDELLLLIPMFKKRRARSSLLAEVGLALADADPNRAELIARDAEKSNRTQTGAIRKPDVMVTIAGAWLRIDLEHANRLMEEIVSSVDGYLSGMAQQLAALAGIDPDEAERLALKLIAVDPTEGMSALKEIIKSLATTDPSRAERIALVTYGPKSGVESFYIASLAVDIAREVPELAERMVMSLASEDHRDEGLQKLALSCLPWDLERAQRLALRITDKNDRVETLGAVVEALAPRHVERADRLLRHFKVDFWLRNSEHWRAAALAAIGRALSAKDPRRARKLLEEALELANALSGDDFSHARTLSAVGHAMLGTDRQQGRDLLERAATIVESTDKEPMNFHWVYIAELAVRLADTDPERAERLAYKIPAENSYTRIDALVDIAERLHARDTQGR